MKRLRFEINDVYRLFTENDDKIVENYIKTKEQINSDIAYFKTQIGVFDNTIQNMKNLQDGINIAIDSSNNRIDNQQKEIIAIK